jgi:hypothetical protein
MGYRKPARKIQKGGRTLDPQRKTSCNITADAQYDPEWAQMKVLRAAQA